MPKAHASKGSEAKRTAEALFETKSIAEIREVRAPVRTQGSGRLQQHGTPSGSAANTAAWMLTASSSAHWHAASWPAGGEADSKGCGGQEAAAEAAGWGLVQVRSSSCHPPRSVVMCRCRCGTYWSVAEGVHALRAHLSGRGFCIRRDLIESADKIVAISNVCGQILGNVKGVRVSRCS